MKWLVAFLFFVAPVSAFAAVGFAQESVWLSHTPVISGETVSIYAALTNGSAETLTSVAYFRDNGKKIGSLPVSLKPGEARIVSISWTPSSGEHALAVELASSSVALAKGTETTNVTVEKPVAFGSVILGSTKDAAAAAAYTDSSDIQKQIESLSPAVEHFVEPAFTKIDDWRKSGASFLNIQADAARAKADAYSKQKTEQSGTDTPEGASKGWWLTLSQILYTILLYIYTALQTVLAKAGLFFPILAILFFWLLWKLYKRFTRPKYRY